MDDEEAKRLNDCLPGDMVAIRWEGKPFGSTDQIVIYCGPIGHGASAKRKKTKVRDNSDQFAMVEVVDQETMLPMKRGVGRRFNAYVLQNLEVITIVRPSGYTKLSGEHERRVEALGDVDDPLMRRGVDLARAAGRGELT